MNELSPQQIGILERFISAGFSIVAFPLYGNAVGVRKGTCAVLLDPIAAGGLRLYGEPCILLGGNLTVRVKEKDRLWFVWKTQRLEATSERLVELGDFLTQVKILLDTQV